MQPTATVDEALRRADELLARHPAVAARQAEAVLEVVPGEPRALLIQGAARARLGDLAGALQLLEALAAAQPRAPGVHLELGRVLAASGATEPAIAAMQHALSLKPDLANAWRPLADLLFLAGRTEQADEAYGRHLLEAVRDPALLAAGDALVGGDLAAAERMLRQHLKAAPTDVAAIRMLAEIATRLGRYAAAERLLARCLELAPGFAGARYNLAVVLYRQNRAAEAVVHMERLIALAPDDPSYRLMLAAALASTGHYERAIDYYAALVAQSPALPRLWLGYGHVLRTAGQRDRAIAAYRRIFPLAPGMGEAWWSLANLKTGTLDQADIAAMRAALEPAAGSVEDRFHLHYAIGRALEEQGAHEDAFAHYAAGAKLRRAEVSYDADTTTRQIDRTIALLTPALLAVRQGCGCADPAPIFIVGLPRSGSTLIEQMLASHDLVEGTMELPELPNVAREMSPEQDYPQALADIAPDALAGWGQRYLDRAQPYRRTARPFFIDKMPNNWIHVGLIQLILPHAKIIDARRNPMASCFSAFKQHFARGQHYSYDLTELARYYLDYVRLMAHVDAVLPGRVHRVHYEAMVDDTEAELRRLLDYCGLEFQPDCLRFYDNTRAVRTASSEQVRQPIFRHGLDHWRNFEPWLAELGDALSQGQGLRPPAQSRSAPQPPSESRQ